MFEETLIGLSCGKKPQLGQTAKWEVKSFHSPPPVSLPHHPGNNWSAPPILILTPPHAHIPPFNLDMYYMYLSACWDIDLPSTKTVPPVGTQGIMASSCFNTHSR